MMVYFDKIASFDNADWIINNRSNRHLQANMTATERQSSAHSSGSHFTLFRYAVA